MNVFKRNNFAFSLIETMTIIAVVGIVLGLLYAYQERGWKLFYQSYGRGLSQIKAKTAIRVLVDELREANRNRISIGQGTSYGVPLPDDTQNNTPYIYFTKPKNHELTGEVIGYDYVLYYFARPKEKTEPFSVQRTERKTKDIEKLFTLKSIKFINQSKFYTEDQEKTWPFLPPILELQKSTLPEDEAYIESLKGDASPTPNVNPDITLQKQQAEQNLFLDHFARIKKESRNIPLSGNFLASSLTDPFTKEEVSIYFGSDYKNDKPIKIKVAIEEPPFLFGLMSSMTTFEVKVTPRN